MSNIDNLCSDGTITGDCEWCGRNYFNSADACFFDDGELEEKYRLQKIEPNKYIEVDHTVGLIYWMGKQGVVNCDCKWDVKLENSLFQYRRDILNMYKKYLEFKEDEVKILQRDINSVQEIS
jgi:hypothetical protein